MCSQPSAATGEAETARDRNKTGNAQQRVPGFIASVLEIQNLLRRGSPAPETGCRRKIDLW
jgi:hypothetical protein